MEKEILKEIEEYVNSSSAYLSQSNDYSRGFKDGVMRVKDIIKGIIAKLAAKNQPQWRFCYNEEIFDYLGDNFFGVLTNGESFLFYHILPTEEGKIETCHIYSSMMSMYQHCPEVSYPATKENDAKVLDALNSLTKENRSRFCGENSILFEVKFEEES